MVGKEWLLSFILQILFASQASPNLRMVLDVVEMWASSSLLSVRGSGKRLLLSENKWENLSKLCTNLVSNWTWQNVGEGSACIYSTVLKSRKCWVNTWTRLRCCCCCFLLLFKLVLSYDISFSVIFFFLCWDFFPLSPMPLHQCSQLKSSFISCLFVTNVWDAGMRTWLAIVLMTNEREANTACLSAATVVQQGWQ